MKNIITLCFIVFAAFQLNAQEEGHVNWKSVEEAQTASKKDGKPILIDAYTVWCGPCKMLTKLTFKDSTVAAYLNENFHAVKFNAEGNAEIKFNGVTYKNPNYKPENKYKRNAQHEMAQKLEVNAYPTILFIDSKGEVIKTELGFRSPDQMMAVLEKLVDKGSK